MTDATKSRATKPPCPCCDNPAGAKRIPLALFLRQTEKPLVLIRSVRRPYYAVATHDPARGTDDVNAYDLGAEFGTVGGDGRWRWLGGEAWLGEPTTRPTDRIISIEAWSDPVQFDRDVNHEMIEGAEYEDYEVDDAKPGKTGPRPYWRARLGSRLGTEKIAR